MSKRKADFKKILNNLRYSLRYIGIELILYYLVKETLNPDSDKNLTGEPKDFTFGFLDEADIKKIGFCPDRNKPWLTEEKLLEKFQRLMD